MNETSSKLDNHNSSNRQVKWIDFVDKTSLNKPKSDPDSSTVIVNQLIPIYFTILGLIIALLLIYVLYKMWRQRQHYYLTNKYSLPVTNKDTKHGGKAHEFHDNLYSSVNKDQKNLRNSNSSSYKQNPLISWVETNNNLVRDGDADEISVSFDKQSAQEGKCHKVENQMLNKQIFGLPTESIDALIYSLSDESSQRGWKDLAKHQGFTESDIISISQQIQLTKTNNSELNNDQPIKSQLQQHSANHFQQQQYRQDCIRLFIKKWSESDIKQNTTRKLIKCLTEVERPDTALLLWFFMKKYAYQTTNSAENANSVAI